VVSSRAALPVALRAARCAGAIALRAFGTRLRVHTKADATPVTAIDRAGELAIRRIIARAFPADGFLGEEHGSTRPDAPVRWIMDPIDGTKNYIRGIPFWGTLVAREVLGRIDVGVVCFPALRQTLWAARGGGAFLDGRRIRVSRVSDLNRAYIQHGDLEAFHKRGALPRLAAIAARCAMIRSFGDCPAYRWVASGQAEAMIEASISPWDIAALKIIVEEAGGRMTDWRGRDTHMLDQVIASNGRLHRPLLNLLRG
jgi:histidinol phosphatase-like enzyme (inositol monophosphatase family)